MGLYRQHEYKISYGIKSRVAVNNFFPQTEGKLSDVSSRDWYKDHWPFQFILNIET